LLTSGSQVALHFLLGIVPILLPAWFLTQNVAFLASVTTSLAFLSFLLAYVHGCIHNPQGRWIERQGWFMWLDRHHYIHHVDQTANINFLLPLCDLLFGTRKAQMSPEEAAHHPSFEEAKPLAWDVRMAARP
jgi:sterol desaturase/sphingolipid hydroxylase (fatty acid hydroxylase superfamily)